MQLAKTLVKCEKNETKGNRRRRNVYQQRKTFTALPPLAAPSSGSDVTRRVRRVN